VHEVWVPSSQGEPYSFVSKLQILSSQALRIELPDSVYDAAQIFASIIWSDKIVWPSQRGKKLSAFVVFGLFSRAQMLVVSQQSHVPEKGKFRIERAMRVFRLFGCPLTDLSHWDAHTLKTKAARDDI
jgi:hypothetical protein